MLESFREVYGNDARAREQNMTAEQRLAFYQTHSGPVLEKLKAWLEAQFAEKQVEPNSGLGVAITYLLKHWDRLTLFLKQPGSPLDNNIVTSANGSDDVMPPAGLCRVLCPSCGFSLGDLSFWRARLSA